MPLRPSGAVWQLLGTSIYWGRERVKHSSIVHLVCMACSMCDVCVTDCTHTPLISCSEMIPKLGSKHSLTRGCPVGRARRAAEQAERFKLRLRARAIGEAQCIQKAAQGMSGHEDSCRAHVGAISTLARCYVQRPKIGIVLPKLK
jgi:hypothetical protein